MHAIPESLNFFNTFHACVWTICCCAFFGLMRFSEVTERSRSAFDGSIHAKRSDVLFNTDLNGCSYAKISLPRAKTAKPGKVQDVFLVKEGNGLSPLHAFWHMAFLTSARANDSWRDRCGDVRPATKDAMMKHINSILQVRSWGTSFDHSFRIGGASFYLGKGVSPEIV